MKTRFSLQTARHAVRDLLCVSVGVLAASSPVAVLGQANYATPYTFTTLAGQAGVAGSANGANSAARFQWPAGVVVDNSGNLYVADYGNNTVRKVTPAGVVTTLAGRAGVSGSADGTNSAARFNYPLAVAVDSAGNLYVSDINNYTVRKVTPVGTNWVVTTLAGRAGVAGSADGTNDAARFNWPAGLALDGAGNLYVSDNNSLIRKVTPVGTNWVVTTVAGWAGAAGSVDGTNSAARFNFSASGNGYGGLALDSAGNLYVADYGNNTVRKVTPVGTNWVVTTVAGKAGIPESTDGTGSDGTGSAARFDNPVAVALDSAGNLYVADFVANTIRKGFPASSVPPPILEPPSLSAGRFGFEITGLPGLAVNIQSSSNMSSWVFAGTCTLNGGSNSFVIPAPSQATMFYRAQVR